VSRLRRPAKPLIALVALGLVALVFSACAFLKLGSLSLSQPAGIGPARVHVVICTVGEGEGCGPAEEDQEVQYLLGIAAPPGSTPPPTVTAVPTGGGSPLVFNLSAEVSSEMAAASATLHKAAEEEGEGDEPFAQAWPPAGLQGFGYISNAHQEQEGVQVEWNADADFGLPVAADGSPFPGPFATGISYGVRFINPGNPASRPVHCIRFEKGTEEPTLENLTLCLGTLEQGQIGTSDLKIAAPKKTSAFVGGKGTVKFPLNFASTAAPYPAFSLTATSTLGKAKLASNTYAPAAPDPTTHLSAPGSGDVTVTVPNNAKPGTYQVVLNATAAPGGGATSQVGLLKVAKPKLKFRKLKLNKAKGFAILKVKVPSAGTLTATGKGLVKAKKKTKKAKVLSIKIRTKGRTKAQLTKLGKVKVKAKVRFKPSSGIAVTKAKTITLKQN
jgi:hypothetical protein